MSLPAAVGRFDLDRARRDTPALDGQLFFDSAGSSLPPTPVVDAVIDYVQLEARVGGYRAREEAEPAIASVYTEAARLIGCARHEVALLENATRAWGSAFYALPFARGDRILLDTTSYGSNYLACLQVARRTGAEIVVIPDGIDGQLDLDALAALADSRAKLIALTWVPTGSGRVNPAAAVGAIARAHGIPFLLDACQAVGHLPVDVAVLGCDFLSATGRKYLRAPRGTGFLYVREAHLDRLEPPVVDVRSAEWLSADTYRLQPGARRFETWEMNYSAVLGLGAALAYAQTWGVQSTAARIRELATRLRSRLTALDGVTVHETGAPRCGIITFSVVGLSAQEAHARLAEQGCTVSISRRSSQLLDFDRRGLAQVVRASVHYFNNAADIDAFAAGVARLVRRR